MEGELLHKRAHDAYFTEKRKDVIISRGLPVHSRTMGVSGVCDIVEFCRAEDGIPLFGHRGLCSVYPVEYKKGAPKDTEIDILQLTAQAMCLEEMLSAKIQEGAIFYGETRRRDKIVFNDTLRGHRQKGLRRNARTFERRYTPKVKWSKSCGACSLKDICMPRLGNAPSVRDYISKDTVGGCVMKKLLNTLYITSPDSYLSLDGENIVILDGDKELGRIPPAQSRSCRLFLATAARVRLLWEPVRIEIFPCAL